MDGRISCEEFNYYLDDFIERSRSIGDEWQVGSSPECFEDSAPQVRYLLKQFYKEITNISGQASGQAGDLDPENTEVATNELDECECVTDVPTKIYAKYEYHVIYSPSYGVPVLYFSASTQDGCPLSLEEVWTNIPNVYQPRLKQERWTFLTQQEHPILGKPYFQLHPCHTADMMKSVVGCFKMKSSNYLITWLSSVGPVVGLHLSMEYAHSA